MNTLSGRGLACDVEFARWARLFGPYLQILPVGQNSGADFPQIRAQILHIVAAHLDADLCSAEIMHSRQGDRGTRIRMGAHEHLHAPDMKALQCECTGRAGLLSLAEE